MINLLLNVQKQNKQSSFFSNDHFSKKKIFESITYNTDGLFADLADLAFH